MKNNNLFIGRLYFVFGVLEFLFAISSTGIGSVIAILFCLLFFWWSHSAFQRHKESQPPKPE